MALNDGPISIVLTDDAIDSIRRYTDCAIELENQGDADRKTLEDARSYACDALRRILNANPQHFDFVERVVAARRSKAGAL